MIHTPMKKLYVATKPMIHMKGFFRVQTINRFSGKVTSDTGFFPNKLLTAGMNIMADRSDWMNFCQLGTDNTAPQATDTSLLGHFVGTDILKEYSTVNGQQGSAPYFGWKRKTWRFEAGTAAANLSEAGIGWGASGSTLISRALIIDPITQLPTTVTPLPDEIVDVTYELRYYPPLVDTIGPSITLDGVIYDTLSRAASVTGGAWSDTIGSKMGVIAGTTKWIAYNGAIGTILTAPSGTSYGCDTSTQYNSAYSNNSLEVQLNCPVGPGAWNASGGIRSMLINTTAGAYQTEFSSNPGALAIPKTSSYTMIMRWFLSWGELPPDWEAGTYAAGDKVTHNDVQWISDIDSNTSEPGVANWTLV